MLPDVPTKKSSLAHETKALLRVYKKGVTISPISKLVISVINTRCLRNYFVCVLTFMDGLAVALKSMLDSWLDLVIIVSNLL